MKRIPWTAVGWFALSVIALGMSISAFRSPLPRIGLPPPQGVPPTSPAVQFKPAQHSQSPQPVSAGIAQPPSKTTPPLHGAGVQLIKCVIHGQVTYTNNRQECPAATASKLTVYPTQGYLPTKP